MQVELTRLLAAERAERLREAAQAPPGALAMLIRRGLRRDHEAQAPVAWIGRASRTALDRRAA